MIHRIAKSITDFMLKKGSVKEDYEIYEYGVEVILANAVGVVGIIFFSIILNRFYHGLIFILLYALLRTRTGGYHADTYIKCNTYFYIIFVLLNLISDVAAIYNMGYVTGILVLIGYIVVCAYAPVENVNKRLSAESKDINNRISKSIYGTLIILMCAAEMFFRYNMFNLPDMYSTWTNYCCFINIVLISIVVLMLIGLQNDKSR